MNRLLYVGLASSLLLLAGCSKGKRNESPKENIETPKQEINELIVHAVYSAFRTSNTGWVKGDAIGCTLLDESNQVNVKYMTADGTETFKATPSKGIMVSSSADLLAYYPYSERVGAELKYAINIEEQSNFSAIDLMVAKANVAKNAKEVTLPFEHLLARLDITLEGQGISEAKATIKETPTTATVSLKDKSFTTGDTKKEISVKLKSQNGALLLFPKEKLSSITFNINGKEQVYTLEKPLTLEAGKKHQLTFEYKATEGTRPEGKTFTLTLKGSDISPWAEGHTGKDDTVQLPLKKKKQTDSTTQEGNPSNSRGDAPQKSEENKQGKNQGGDQGTSQDAQGNQRGEQGNNQRGGQGNNGIQGDDPNVEAQVPPSSGTQPTVPTLPTDPSVQAPPSGITPPSTENGSSTGGTSADSGSSSESNSSNSSNSSSVAKPEESNLPPLFSGSDFENWETVKSGVDSSTTTQSEEGHRGKCLHFKNETTRKSGFIFKVKDLPAGKKIKKIVFYLKGTANKALNVNIPDKSGKDKTFYLKGENSNDISVQSPKGSNSYNGSINTGGKWVKVTLDVSFEIGKKTETKKGKGKGKKGKGKGKKKAETESEEISDAGDYYQFAIKFGNGGNYDIYLDDFSYEE